MSGPSCCWFYFQTDRGRGAHPSVLHPAQGRGGNDDARRQLPLPGVAGISVASHRRGQSPLRRRRRTTSAGATIKYLFNNIMTRVLNLMTA